MYLLNTSLNRREKEDPLKGICISRKFISQAPVANNRHQQQLYRLLNSVLSSL